jgi:hypothetical protein
LIILQYQKVILQLDGLAKQQLNNTATKIMAMTPAKATHPKDADGSEGITGE